MAKNTDAPQNRASVGAPKAVSDKAAARAAKKAAKKPSRLKQVWDVFNMTRRHDPMVVWLMALVLLAAVAAGLLIGQFVFAGNWISGLILGLAVGILGATIILSRRAERAAFAQIEGKPGASGAALGTLRSGWVVEEQPVAVNPRSQDAVFRAVGRPGVVLVTEGPSHRVRTLAQAEQKRLRRILPNVSVHVIETGREENQVPLDKLAKSMRKLKNELTKAEVNAVSKRISSMGSRLPIPKGIDPYKARPDRKAARGR
ncbi:DUF4191 domain-containing protein [Psychromicrobium xiongbiense]|uniref:DUF4191 domain-containing protein n=1 Tax=Psychromicrobium xiongbiense TaxID=3051184 RepID=UPI002554532A|nr:DUF4191 domain-containing protein [Psychromicrobium sp. YIM S02556]